jgi:hypothetical protein
LSDGDDEESFDQPTAPFPFHLMCNKVGDKYKYSDEKASKCLVNNPNFSDLQVVAAEKFLALVAKGKADWEKYRDLFTDNGRYTTLSGMKRNIVIDRETKRFDLHHICQVSLGGSDRLWVNVIPLLCDSDHTKIHVQASVFISDREVQNAAKMMLDLSAMKPSDFLNEGSDEIRMANFTEANKGRFKALSERMKGNSIGAGPHVYPSERKSRGPGSFGGSIFAFGNRHSVVHEDAAILADFGKYKCAGNQWWIKCLGANDGDVVKLDNGRTLVKSSGNKMMATRHVVGKCRSNAKHCAKKAAKKAAKEAAVLVEDDTVRDAARKQWSSFCK